MLSHWYNASSNEWNQTIKNTKPLKVINDYNHELENKCIQKRLGLICFFFYKLKI